MMDREFTDYKKMGIHLNQFIGSSSSIGAKNTNNPEAAEQFKEVAFSYSILSDPEKRRQYDNAGFEVILFLLWFRL